MSKYPLNRKFATGGFCRRYSIAINIGDNKRIKTLSSIRPFLFIAPAQFRSTRPLKKGTIPVLSRLAKNKMRVH